MSKLCTEEVVLETDPPAASDPISIIDNGKSEIVKTDGKGILFGEIQFTVSGFSTTGFTQNAPITGAIIGTGTKVKSKGKNAILDSDSIMLTLSGTTTSTPPTPTTLPITVKIKDPGQQKLNTT